MHLGSMENMRRCIDWYLPNTHQRVIDLGSADVNGSYRELIPDTADYTGFDLEAAPGVDIVLEDPYHIPLEDESVDVVMSGQMLEHCAHFWRVFGEIARVSKPGGLAFMIAPSAGPIHRHPVDCYRFYPDAYQALAEWSGLRLVHWWLDERGPWRDLVGVFQKGGNLQPVSEPPSLAQPAIFEGMNEDPATENVKGHREYLDVLADMHAIIDPKLYVEIGVRTGKSLELCKCDMIGIDPFPALDRNLNALSLQVCTSDDFFFFHTNKLPKTPIDFAFIDGMHLFEFVYRDLMNLEKYMSKDGIIVIDDVLPNHTLQAARDRETRVWCGDVWRIVPLLQEIRPDLHLTLLDTKPTGLLVIRNLDPDNRTLWNQYNPVMRRLLTDEPDLPQSFVTREMAVKPSRRRVRAALGR